MKSQVQSRRLSNSVTRIPSGEGGISIINVVSYRFSLKDLKNCFATRKLNVN